jgi:drug/metabolite transporter (DMT)-like permease
MEEKWYYVKLHFIVMIWGFTAILGLLISIPAVEVVLFRTLIAAIGLLILLKIRGRNLDIGSGAIVRMLATGAIIAAHWILFFGAARVSTASVSLAGIATCSFWTSFLEPLMTRTKIKPYEVFLGFFVIIGLYIIFRFEFTYALGLTMAIISALLASIFTIINGKFMKKGYNPYTITFYEMTGAFLTTSLFLPFYHVWMTNGEGVNLSPLASDWLYLAILAIVCTVYAYSVSVEIMKRLSAFVINLTINLEPVYGIILAFLVFGEKEEMKPAFYIGTFIILLSVLSYPFLNRLHRRRWSKA